MRLQGLADRSGRRVQRVIRDQVRRDAPDSFVQKLRKRTLERGPAERMGRRHNGPTAEAVRVQVVVANRPQDRREPDHGLLVGVAQQAGCRRDAPERARRLPQGCDLRLRHVQHSLCDEVATNGDGADIEWVDRGQRPSGLSLGKRGARHRRDFDEWRIPVKRGCREPARAEDHKGRRAKRRRRRAGTWIVAAFQRLGTFLTVVFRFEVFCYGPARDARSGSMPGAVRTRLRRTR